MSAIRRLSDVLYAEEVERARRTDPGEKLLEGPRLFDRACRVMIDGIRHERPDLDEASIRALLAARLDRLGRLDEP